MTIATPSRTTTTAFLSSPPSGSAQCRQQDVPPSGGRRAGERKLTPVPTAARATTDHATAAATGQADTPVPQGPSQTRNVVASQRRDGRAARRSAQRRLRAEGRALGARDGDLLDREAGMATAEYAIATLAAVGFAALLVAVLSSGQIKGLLTSLITTALNFG